MRVPLRLSSFGLVVLASPLALAQGAAPAPVPVQRPQNPLSPPAAAAPTEAPTAVPVPPSGPPGVTSPAPTTPPAPGDPTLPAPPAQPAQPAPPSQATQPTQPTEATPPTSESAPATPGLAEQLLGPSVAQHPDRRPDAPVRSESEAAAAEDEAIAAVYRDMFRPKSNPGRFHLVARAQYAIGSSFDGTLSGRTGGAQVDIGQSFNFIGYAASLRAEGGAIDFGENSRSQLTGILGGGPTLGLGRLGMLQRGYIDLRLGYDFLYAPARQRQDDGGVKPLPGLVLHGPRGQLSLGLLINPGRSRRLFHGVGVSLGYQVFVGAFRGDIPASQFLQFGLHYWGS